MSSAAGGAALLVKFFLIDLVVLQITHAISVNMLDMEFMKPFQDTMTGDEEWNAFGIRRVKRGEISVPSTPRPEKIEFPSRNREIPISPFITRGLKSIGKVFVYNSTVEKKVEVQVVQIKSIKRIGGDYPYGPRNGSTVELKEPIFVVRRRLNEIVEPSYWQKFRQVKDYDDYVTWIPDATSAQTTRLPYRIVSSDFRCRYCFAYWARQTTVKPENLYEACCPRRDRRRRMF